jgi:ankyrin repeat protein
MFSHRFRWVYCQLEVLRHCFPTNVRRVIEELPESLDETYERILKGITKTNKEYAYRLLQCLAVAARPLRVEDLADILIVDFKAGGVPTLNADWRWEDQEEAVLSACSSLVTVIIDDGCRVVQFSHFSVKEFLTSERLANSIGEPFRFHISLEPAHAILAQACLGVLLRLEDHTNGDNTKSLPLVEYAAECWVEHAQFTGVELRIKDVMDYFLDMDKPHFLAWIRMQDVYDLLPYDSNTPRAAPLPAAPLYFAARHGFRYLSERIILKHPQHVNAWGGLCGTPLHSSVRWGQIEISQLLHAHGADVNARSSFSCTPLHIASMYGLLDTVNWLLDHGADLESLEMGGMTPLQLSSSRGHLEVTRILLERGAEIDSLGDKGSTPLQLAMEEGELDAALLLLDRHANVHVRDNDGKTLLHLAATNGFLEVARILLTRDLELDSRDDEGRTPLHRASEEGWPDVVLFLLDRGADAHVREDTGKTLLHSAAVNGHPDVAQILLEHSVDVDSRNNDGSTPLHFASEGELDVVRLLLDHGVDVNARDNAGNTPLHVAAFNGRGEVIQILLERNADANALNNRGFSPLHIAMKEGESVVVQLLATRDTSMGGCADVRVRGWNPSEDPSFPEEVYVSLPDWSEFHEICGAEVINVHESL